MPTSCLHDELVKSGPCRHVSDSLAAFAKPPRFLLPLLVSRFLIPVRSRVCGEPHCVAVRSSCFEPGCEDLTGVSGAVQLVLVRCFRRPAEQLRNRGPCNKQTMNPTQLHLQGRISGDRHVILTGADMCIAWWKRFKILAGVWWMSQPDLYPGCRTHVHSSLVMPYCFAFHPTSSRLVLSNVVCLYPC